MADIFVSYAHEDRPRVTPLVARLEAEGWSVWWDRELVAGDRFERSIDEAISDARAVVVAWSRAALASQWVHNEALEGLDRGILVPLLLETVRVPVAFRQLQVANLHRWPEQSDPAELDTLLAGIRGVLGPDADASSTAADDDARIGADIAELERLRATGETEQATRVAQSLHQRAPRNERITALWHDLSSVYQLESEPVGAEVFSKPYDSPDAAWQPLGTTPLEIRLANGLHRLLVTKDGFDAAEFADAVPGLAELPEFAEVAGARLPRLVELQQSDPDRGAMIYVPAADVVSIIAAGGVLPKAHVPGFFMGRFPVTNREFKAFLEAGGYDDAAYWTDTDLDAVRERCCDSTARTGPAGWRFGRFPEGEEDYPVTGVCWHEAAAFARFRGGALPTVIQWNRAAREFLELVSPFAGAVVTQSNFTERLKPVHASPAIGAFGIRDLAGNAREWVRNPLDRDRATLGGSHLDPPYLFVFNARCNPWQRDATTGFRILVSTEDDSHLNDPIADFGEPRDLEPVSDDAFEMLRSQFSYTPQVARVSRTELPVAERRRLHERHDLQYPDGTSLTLFVERQRDQPVSPPIIVFPGQGEFMLRRETDPRELFAYLDLLLESGRALIMPVYHGSNERYAGVWQMSEDDESIYYRDVQPVWRREIGRTLDYLESCDFADVAKATYLGLSYGVAFPLPAAIMEPRFRAYALLHGGLFYWDRDVHAPVADAKNFLPRLTKPVFQLNGNFDTIFPFGSQEALHERIATPADDKFWLRIDGGHGYTGEAELLALVDWLDRQLGAPD